MRCSGSTARERPWLTTGRLARTSLDCSPAWAVVAVALSGARVAVVVGFLVRGATDFQRRRDLGATIANRHGPAPRLRHADGPVERARPAPQRRSRCENE